MNICKGVWLIQTFTQKKKKSILNYIQYINTALCIEFLDLFLFVTILYTDFGNIFIELFILHKKKNPLYTAPHILYYMDLQLIREFDVAHDSLIGGIKCTHDGKFAITSGSAQGT